jgi:1-acyl-sn-glycerol-3-phosphate acyltransferase
MRHIDYWWRLGVTGGAFAFVFFGGGVLAATLLPLLALLPGHRRERVQLIIHTTFRFYLKLLRLLGLFRLEVEGTQHLDLSVGRLIIANHPSLLDVVVLMALIPRTQCIVKHQLWEHRLLGPLMRQAGYISNNLAPDALVAACRAALRTGNSLIIFPEGTRSQPGCPLRLQRGFAHLAAMTGAHIQPVFISCDPPTLVKGEPWWHIPVRRPVFRLVVDECLDVQAFAQDKSRSIAARKLQQYFGLYYGRKMADA